MPTRTKIVKAGQYELDPRWPRFVQLLLEYQNASKAALEAGYAPATARTASHLMAARVLHGLKAALWRKGMAVDRMADKLLELFEAKKPIWNADFKYFQMFPDHATQLAAYDRIKIVLEPEPPKRLEVDVLVGVRRDEARIRETADEWEARNQSRRLQTRGEITQGQVVSTEEGPSKSNGHSRPKGGS